MDLRNISNTQLIQEEQSFYSRYKNSIKKTLENCNSIQFDNYFDAEIGLFNQWFIRKEEIEQRKLNSKRVHRNK